LKQKKDILIIGGGPIGIACALECKKRNLDYIVLEKGALTNSLFNYPLNMSFFSTSEKLEIDEIPFISTNPKPNRNEALEYYRRVATSNTLAINLYEEVLSISKTSDGFLVLSNLHDYSVNKVIIATGFYDLPKLLEVPGENLPKVSHYTKRRILIHYRMSSLLAPVIRRLMPHWKSGKKAAMLLWWYAAKRLVSALNTGYVQIL